LRLLTLTSFLLTLRILILPNVIFIYIAFISSFYGEPDRDSWPVKHLFLILVFNTRIFYYWVHYSIWHLHTIVNGATQTILVGMCYQSVGLSSLCHNIAHSFHCNRCLFALLMFRDVSSNHHMTFGLFFETSLAAFLCYCPGLDKGLRMYPLRWDINMIMQFSHGLLIAIRNIITVATDEKS